MIPGILSGMAAAACFGAGAVCIRLGMRGRPGDDGVFMTVMMNTAVFGLLFVLVTPPAWDWTGAAGFALSGLLGTSLGRWFSFRAVRRVGASRANAFLITAPLFAAVGGRVVLGERLDLTDVVGAGLVLAGLGTLVRGSTTAASLVEPGPAPALGDGLGRTMEGRYRAVLSRLDSGRASYAYAIVAPVLLGAAFVARKFGLLRYPHPVAGGFLTVATAFVSLVLASAARGRLRATLERATRPFPWWFAAAGLAMSAGLLLQLGSFLFLPAWLVSLLLGTQGLWTLFWSYLFIRREERIGPSVVAAVALVVLGVSFVAVSG